MNRSILQGSVDIVIVNLNGKHFLEKCLPSICEQTQQTPYRIVIVDNGSTDGSQTWVKEQFPDRKLIACLELHTYSSLNAEFLKEYRGALKEADVSAVFYIPESVKIKGLEEITKDQIAQAFQQQDINIFTNSAAFKEFLFKQDVTNSILLFMSSGNYGGLDLNEVVSIIKTR